MSNQTEERAAALARILNTAATVPLDQAGNVLWPQTDYWPRLRQRASCAFGHHAWGRPWIHVTVVPTDQQVSFMLKGAPWPREEIRDCPCGARCRKRLT